MRRTAWKRAEWRDTTPRTAPPPLTPTEWPAGGEFLDRLLIALLGLAGTAIVLRLFLPF